MIQNKKRRERAEYALSFLEERRHMLSVAIAAIRELERTREIAEAVSSAVDQILATQDAEERAYAIERLSPKDDEIVPVAGLSEGREGQ